MTTGKTVTPEFEVGLERLYYDQGIGVEDFKQAIRELVSTEVIGKTSMQGRLADELRERLGLQPRFVFDQSHTNEDMWPEQKVDQDVMPKAATPVKRVSPAPGQSRGDDAR
jgi:hypothetical protein